MIRARVRNTGSSLPWYFSMIAFTDSASMRAWAGSYTPQGRSQCAWATVDGRKSRIALTSRFDTYAGSTKRPYPGIDARSEALIITARPAAPGRLPYLRVRVSGPSMVPTLRHGDVVVVRRGVDARAGDVVLAKFRALPDRLVVKRAVRRQEDGWWLRSDNP